MICMTNPISVKQIDAVAAVQVLATNVTKGEGTAEDPLVAYTQFWTTNGIFIGEIQTNDIPAYIVRHCII